jgi:DNA-binding transcriptional LysR family regulator
MSGLEVESCRSFFAAREAAPGPTRKADRLKALAGETFIIQRGLYASTIAACHAAGFTPRIGPEASRIASTLNLVSVGLGISLVPASLQRMHIDGVTYRRLKGGPIPRHPLNLASRRGDSSAVVRHFLNLVKRAAKDFRLDDSKPDIRGIRKRT